MYVRKQPSRELLREAQWTNLMVGREALLRDGFTDRMLWSRVTSGAWMALGKGIYRLAPDPLTWGHYAVAATLAYGPSAAVGGDAAAYAFRLNDQEPTTVLVRVPGTHPPRATGLWRPRVDKVGRCERAFLVDDKRRIGGTVRLTTLADTVIDLLPGLGDDDDVVSLVCRALSRGATVAGELLYLLGERRRIPRRPLLTELVDDANGIGSALEYRYRRDCEQPHGLPEGERQAAIRRGAFHDVGYRAYRTLVELDGLRYHAGGQQFRDMDRDNASAELGFETLRYGWKQVVSQPCEVAAQVARILRRRGWTGEFRRCPRCSDAVRW